MRKVFGKKKWLDALRRLRRDMKRAPAPGYPRKECWLETASACDAGRTGEVTYQITAADLDSLIAIVAVSPDVPKEKK